MYSFQHQQHQQQQSPSPDQSYTAAQLDGMFRAANHLPSPSPRGGDGHFMRTGPLSHPQLASHLSVDVPADPLSRTIHTPMPITATQHSFADEEYKQQQQPGPYQRAFGQ